MLAIIVAAWFTIEAREGRIGELVKANAELQLRIASLQNDNIESRAELNAELTKRVTILLEANADAERYRDIGIRYGVTVGFAVERRFPGLVDASSMPTALFDFAKWQETNNASAAELTAEAQRRFGK